MSMGNILCGIILIVIIVFFLLICILDVKEIEKNEKRQTMKCVDCKYCVLTDMGGKDYGRMKAIITFGCEVQKEKFMLDCHTATEEGPTTFQQFLEEISKLECSAEERLKAR